MTHNPFAQGQLRCRRCNAPEIEGLEFCLSHMPDDRLDEAEELCGYRRCRNKFGTPDACTQNAVKGTDPLRCKAHGANLGSFQSRAASANVVEGRVVARMTEIMGAHGDRLLHPGKAPDPLAGLLELADEMNEWKNIMREVVAYLVDQQRVRSAHSRVGEQLRAEVLIYERAIERLAQLWEKIIRLGIEGRMAKITEIQFQRIDSALATALNASGLDLTGQEKARQVLRRELVRGAK